LAVQALEVYHRRTNNGGIIGDSEYAELVKALLDAVPETTTSEMMDKLSRSLQYANDPTLGQRIKTIVNPLKDVFGSKPVGMSKNYISRIVNTRNYNTHFSAELKRSGFTSGAELHWATRRIVTLLTIVLLRHIDVPSEVIIDAMKKNREFNLLLATEGVPPL